MYHSDLWTLAGVTSLIAFSLNILLSSVSFAVCDFSLHLLDLVQKEDVAELV